MLNPCSFLRILYAEDDSTIRELTSVFLKKYYHYVDVAFDGKEAIDFFSENRGEYDIIITDIYMPKKTGLDLAEFVRRTNRTIPIVAISAYDDKEYLFGAIEHGVTRYVIKPFDNRSLLELIDSLTLKLEPKELYEFLFDGEVCTFEFKKRVLKIKDETINLNKKESEFINLFFINSRGYFSIKDLSQYLWRTKEEKQNAVYSFIKRMKKKIPEDFLNSSKIYGYYLNIKPIV